MGEVVYEVSLVTPYSFKYNCIPKLVEYVRR